MLFKIVAGLVVLGLVVWLIGESFDYIGVAALGATMIIIAGSAVALTGLEIQTGEVQNYHYQLENNSSDYVLNKTETAVQYQTRTLGQIMNVGITASLGLGGLLMLLGTILMSQTLARQTA